MSLANEKLTKGSDYIVEFKSGDVCDAMIIMYTKCSDK